MRRILTVYEHQSIQIGSHFDAEKRMISQSQAAQIGRLEASLTKPVFKWGYHQLTPQQWVGYLEIPGLQIEILPKLDKLSSDSNASTIRGNLLYMLLKAGEVPYRESDLASLSTERSSILECYITVFREKLMQELRRGLNHQYISQESNERFLKGKLVLSEHIRNNKFHKERFFIRYDEFSSENMVNRILKATILKLINLSNSVNNVRGLRDLKNQFEGIDESTFHISDFQNIKLSRLHQGYHAIIEMAKVFWQDEMPVLSSGDVRAFSLLFDMNKVYEQFIRNFLQEHEREIFGEDYVVLRKRHKKYLFKDSQDRGMFSLYPDILIQNRRDQSIHMIIDTKWKHLKVNERKLGINQSDMYQMYGYAREYQCEHVVLLYPKFGMEENCLPRFKNDTIKQYPIRVHVGTVDLTLSLPSDNQRLVEQLRSHFQSKDSSKIEK
jgi:5-methylcytosine-specific restriction enzyme subunit McrC